jgi:hypothetical protein
VRNGQLIFEILGGQSSTWGAFGGNGNLRLVIPSSLSNLDAYSPIVSAENSRVGFGGRRVERLALKRVRKFTAHGDVLEDITVHVVHPLNP